MKKVTLILIMLAITRLAIGQDIETWSLSELPHRTNLHANDKTFVEDSEEYSYHTTLADIFGYIEDSLGGGTGFWLGNADDSVYYMGKVGINTNAPVTDLHVNGNIAGDFPVGKKTYFVMTDGDDQVLYKADSTGAWSGGSSSPWTQSGDSIYPNSLTAYIGIGTSTPAYSLDVNGNINANGTLYLNDIEAMRYQNISLYVGRESNAVWLYNPSNNGVIIGSAYHNYYWNWQAYMSVTGGGVTFPNYNVAIGHNTPTEALDVVGNAKFSGNVTNDTTFVDVIGVGTTTPSNSILDIVDETTNDKLLALRKYNTNVAGSPNIDFYKYNGTTGSYAAVANGTALGDIEWNASYDGSNTGTVAAIAVKATQAHTSTTQGTNMAFYTTENDSSTWAPSMTIDEHANVEVPHGDVIVKQGWRTWSSTLAWTGGTPTSAPTVVARFQTINETVTFELDISGTNDSGNALTAITASLPETPDDINAYWPVSFVFSNTTKSSAPTTVGAATIDAEDNTPANRKLSASGFNILNTADYRLSFSGHYEITGD